MLEERIQKDYVQAMKDRDAIRSGAVNFLRAQLKNVRINERKDQLTDEDVIAVIKKQIKQRQDSIEQFSSGGRQDLVAKEEAELKILKSYLPEELSEAQLQTIIRETMKETGASTMKDMGSLMKAAGAKIQGRADNKLVSELVKKALSGQ